MSKFFNESLKAQRTKSPVAVATQEQETAPKTNGIPPRESSQSADLGASRVMSCRRLEKPLIEFLKEHFIGSTTLEGTEESYRAVRTRLLRIRTNRGIRSVVVTSATPGEGKTLTSFNLGFCCAQLQDMRVLLIDGDLRTRGLTRLLGAPTGPGLSDVLSGDCKPEEAVLSTDCPNLYVLASGLPASPCAELLANPRWQELIAWCSESFALTLVDSPPALNLTDVELITTNCDGVVMVVRAHETKRDLLEQCARQLDKKKLLGVVFNGAESNGRQYEYVYGSTQL